MDKEQVIQEKQYEYPYHYIPKWGKKGFSQNQYWGWGYRYLGGIKVVLDQLRQRSFESLVDIGCGEGRFLKEVAATYSEIQTLGVDYSERAIQLAQALNPDIRFEAQNIMHEPLSNQFDVAVMIEVLEHIPSDEVNAFVKSVCDTLQEEGILILTVPHNNSSLADKHYQHFDSANLRNILEPHFSSIRFVPFDIHPGKLPLSKRLPMSLMRRMMGGNGNHFVVTDSRLNNIFFNYYLNNYLYGATEQNCSRICAIAKSN